MPSRSRSPTFPFHPCVAAGRTIGRPHCRPRGSPFSRLARATAQNSPIAHAEQKGEQPVLATLQHEPAPPSHNSGSYRSSTALERGVGEYAHCLSQRLLSEGAGGMGLARVAQAVERFARYLIAAADTLAVSLSASMNRLWQSSGMPSCPSRRIRAHRVGRGHSGLVGQRKQ